MDFSILGFPVLHYLPELAQTHVHWVSDAIQLSYPVAPISSCPQSFPASGFFPVSQLFTWGGQSIRTSALASILPVNIQDWFSLKDWLVCSPYCPSDSEESSPAPQFESIKTSTLSLLYGWALMSVHVCLQVSFV